MPGEMILLRQRELKGLGCVRPLGERACDMEFHEKLQTLRKQRGLTQEEVAAALYVSRTAISKWESGRGYPSIDSLKAISGFYSVAIDDLLSGAEAVTIAEEEKKEKEARLRDLVFGLLDCGGAMLLFLPFFGQGAGEGARAVSLLGLTGVQPLVKWAFLGVTGALVLFGVLTLAMQTCRHRLWERCRRGISLGIHTAGVLLFILGRQPYAAVFLFLFLGIKGVILLKRR